eukprot:4208407-Ditylum_brightwellii.AAC.1
MKKFLKLFGVDDDQVSPFAVQFESCSDLTKAYVNYQPQTFTYNNITSSATSDVNNNNKEEEEEEEDGNNNDNEDINITCLQNLVNLAIGDTNGGPDGGVDSATDGVTDDGTTNALPADLPKVYEVALVSSIHVLLTCSSVEHVPHCCIDTMRHLALSKKEGEGGSVSDIQKYKSLQQRWFTKVPKSTTADVAAPATVAADSFTIKCNTIIKLKVKKGNQELFALFRVLSFYNKFYNKWNLTMEQAFEWNKKVTKGSCCLN